MLVAGACPFPLSGQAASEISSGWTGYTGEGDYKSSAGNTEPVIQSAHAVRDGKYNKVPSEVTETGEIYDCVVVGGGFAGLSAGLFFHQRATSNRTCLILDNARIFGGVAKRNEFIVDGHRLYAPQASVHFQPPYPNSFLKSIYDAIGLDWNAFKEYQTWQGPAPRMDVARSPYRVAGYPERSTYGFYFGAKFGHQPGMWLTDPWGKNLEGTPFSADERRQMLAWRRGEHIAPPLVYDYPGDAVSRQLDSMTL